MLSPKRVKFRKRFKGRTKGLATRGSEVSFGHYGLKALEPGWVSNRQIEAARVALTRHINLGLICLVPIALAFPAIIGTFFPSKTFSQRQASRDFRGWRCCDRNLIMPADNSYQVTFN